MRMYEPRQPLAHPGMRPLVSFIMGVLALYCSRWAFTGNVYDANSPLVPHMLRTYAVLVHLALSVTVTIVGATALLIGGLSLRESGLSSRYGVAAMIGAVTGGITLTVGLLYLSFIIHVVY